MRNFLLHFEQLNGFSSVWILSCIFKAPSRLNVFSHLEQLNGFSLVWTRSWPFKWCNLLNFLSHSEQLYGFSPVWILSCVFKPHDVLNLKSHLEQVYGFSPVWILSWIFKCSFLVNFLSHSRQLYCLLWDVGSVSMPLPLCLFTSSMLKCADLIDSSSLKWEFPSQSLSQISEQHSNCKQHLALSHFALI